MHSKMGNLHSKVKLFVLDSDFIFGNLYRVYITLCETMQDTKEATKKEKNTAMEQLFIQTEAVMGHMHLRWNKHESLRLCLGGRGLGKKGAMQQFCSGFLPSRNEVFLESIIYLSSRNRKDFLSPSLIPTWSVEANFILVYIDILQ